MEYCLRTVFVYKLMPNKRFAEKKSLNASQISKVPFWCYCKTQFLSDFLEIVFIGGAFSYEFFVIPSFLRYTKLTNSVQQNMICCSIYKVHSISGLSQFLLKFPPVPVKEKTMSFRSICIRMVKLWKIQILSKFKDKKSIVLGN